MDETLGHLIVNFTVEAEPHDLLEVVAFVGDLHGRV